MESSSEKIEKIEFNGTKSEAIEKIKEISPPIEISLCNLTQYSNNSITGYHPTCPWIPPGYEYESDLLIRLHTEIEHFNAYIMPTSTEYALHVQTVKRIESIVLKVWPHRYIEVIGSQKYGLYLPTSEIDLAVQNCKHWNRSLELTNLEDEILASGIAEPNSVEVVSFDTNEIPAMRLIDHESKLKVKIVICANIGNVLKATDLIKGNIHKYPILLKLVFVLRQFLPQHDPNVNTIGISSYGLITMCIRFLQTQPINQVDKNANLGILLVGFFEFFGQTFDFRKNCIENDGRFLPEEEKKRNVRLEYSAKKLCSEDPLIPLNNTTHPLYHVEYLKCAFQYAYNSLLSKADPSIQIDTNDCTWSSLLGRIIQISDKVIEYRKWVSATFK